MDAGRVRRQLLRGPARGRVRLRGRRDGGRARRAPGLAGGPGGPRPTAASRSPRRPGRPSPAPTSSSRSRSVRSRTTCRPSRHPCRPSGPRPCAGLGFGRYEKVALDVRRALLARGRVVTPGAVPPRPGRARVVGLRPRRVRRRSDPGVPHVPLRRAVTCSRPRPTPRPLGDGHARRRRWVAVPRAGGGRGHRLGGRPLRGGRVHPCAPRLHQRRPRPARHTRGRPPPLRGRAHAPERASATSTVR